jgi:RimJ/RimL family protein N-acetyltransferase
MSVAIAPMPELRGARVRLRALAAHDAHALFALHSDTRVMRYWSFPAWSERTQAASHIERISRERASMECYPWAATLLDKDTLIGTCSLSGIHREQRRGVIGFALSSPLWGRGFGSEMLRLALDHAFGALGLDRIEADVDAENLASRALVERAGFKREGSLHARWHSGGGLQETLLYGLRRKECVAR